MKTNKSYWCERVNKIIFLGVLLARMVTPSVADIVIGNANLVFTSPTPPYTWSRVLVAPTTNPSYLGVQIGGLGSGDYEFSTGLIAGSYSLYSATAGADFTSTQALAWDNELIPPSTINFGVGETKLFALWADVDGTIKNQSDSGDDYGWAALTYTGTELTIAGSATATGGGIVVGTYTQIPEPSSILLLTIGSGGILFYRRAKHRQQRGSSRMCVFYRFFLI